MELSEITMGGPVQPDQSAGSMQPDQSAGSGRRDRRRRPVSSESHGELLRLAVKGSDEAWAELVRRLNPMIASIARRTGLNRDDAADVSQETWLQLARKAQSIREPEQVCGWLAQTARRESIRIAISSTRQVPVAEPIDSDIPSDRAFGRVADDALAYQVEPEVAVALSALPPASRRLLGLLVCDADLSYDEIAGRLGIPVGSIGPTRRRALQTLRRHLAVSTVSTVSTVSSRPAA